MSNRGICEKHAYSFSEYETSCPYCIAEQSGAAAQQGLFVRDHRCNCRIGTEVNGVMLMSHDITCPSLVPMIDTTDPLQRVQYVAPTIPDCGPALRKSFEQRPTIMGIPVQLDDTMPVDRVKLQQTELRIHPAEESSIAPHRCIECGHRWEGGRFSPEICGDCHREFQRLRKLMTLVMDQYRAAEEMRIKHVNGVVDGTITDIEGDQKWFYVKLAHSHIALGEALERGDA